MIKQRGWRAPLAGVVGLIALLAMPAVAQAHHVESTAKCVLVGDQPTVTLDVRFVSFSSTKQITGTIRFDGALDRTVVPGDITWSGNNGRLVHTKVTTPGQHTISGSFTWPGKGSDDNGNAHHTVTCPKPNQPGIEIVKSGPATAYVGDQVTFTYKVKNTGDVTLSLPDDPTVFQPEVRDDKCAPVTKVPEPGTNSFDPGDVFTYQCTMTITDAMGDELVNVATACGKYGNTEVCDDDDHKTKIPKPAIALEKTGAATAAAGSTFTYIFRATNTGNVALTNVVLSDPKCQTPLTRVEPNAADATFDPGDQWHYTCTVIAPAGPAQVDNVAEVCGEFDAPEVEPKKVCDDDTHTFTVPPPGTPPGQNPPASVPNVVPPQSEGEVEPERVLSGRASLRGPSGCVPQTFTARVRGRSIASVTFFVDGRRVKRDTEPAFTLKVNPKRYGLGRHRIEALVRFRKASGTPARRLPLTFRRCAQQPVAPRFTG